MGNITGSNGVPVESTNSFRLKVSSVGGEFDVFQNLDMGKVWSVSFEGINPVGAGDYFFYFENVGAEMVGFKDIRLSCSTATGRVDLRVVTGTPTFTAGVDLTPLSRNLGTSPLLGAAVKSDTNVTGLTDVGRLFFQDLPVVDTTYVQQFESTVVIPPGKAVALQWSAATGEISGVVTVIALPPAGEI